ncbi:hypothetical protein K438DRAFT_1786983 [Mycena galopus ATCC 62051]|nr:hypothetical protein K438DRAFT_1786983 [Mycena galopus ATCC 62051]
MCSIFRAGLQIFLGGVGGNGASGGQEGGGGGSGEGARFDHIEMNIQQCYINMGLSDPMNLSGRELSQAVRMHSTTNFTVPNDTAQSFQDTTDELTGAFLELKYYEMSADRDVYYYIEQSTQITIVLRPVGLALQTDTPDPNAFPNVPTAHELVAWKLVDGLDGTEHDAGRFPLRTACQEDTQISFYSKKAKIAALPLPSLAEHRVPFLIWLA